MASLTPLSKGLIGLAVVGAVVSAVWNLGLKDRVQGSDSSSPALSQDSTPIVASTSSSAPNSGPAVAKETAVLPTPTSGTPATDHVGKALTAAESGERGRKLLDTGDYARARIFLEQAVKMGDGSAACHLGEMTLKGKGGIAASQDKAAELFRLAQSRNMICFAPGN